MVYSFIPVQCKTGEYNKNMFECVSMQSLDCSVAETKPKSHSTCQPASEQTAERRIDYVELQQVHVMCLSAIYLYMHLSRFVLFAYSYPRIGCVAWNFLLLCQIVFALVALYWLPISRSSLLQSCERHDSIIIINKTVMRCSFYSFSVCVCEL